MNTALLFAIFATTWGDPPRRAPSPITAAAITGDGNHIVVGSQSSIQIYDWPALTGARQLSTELVSVHDFAFSPTGDQLLAGGGTPGEEGSVEVFSWPAGKLLARRQTNEDLVYRVAWSRFGKS